MTEVLIYLAKVSLVISLIYGLYQLLLKRSTHFALNRAYLIVGIFASILLPFWPVSKTITFPTVFTLNLDPTAFGAGLVQVSGPAERWDLSLCLGLIYCAGLLFMLFRMANIHARLRKLIFNSKKEKHTDFTLISGNSIQFPFSFRKYIFMPAALKNDEATHIILQHEKAHIDGKHSRDILLAEAFLLLQWFNPLAWMYKKSLLALHEYLADQSLIDAGVNKTDYQLLLLKQSAGNQRFALANAFNKFTTIKRINMMNQNKSSKWSRIAYLLLIPALSLSLFSFSAFPSSTELVANITGNKVIKGQVVNAEDQSPIAGATVLVKESNIGALTDENGYFEISVPETESPTLVVNFLGFANYQVKLDNSGVLKVQLGKTISSSKHSFFSPDKIEIDLNKEIKLTSIEAAKPLIIVDGKEVKSGFDMNSISPDDIASVNVVKGEKAIENYGEKGRNGVVEITTKK
ncbi:MAG: carboxypeptidase-like regulatory domain-containing protein [Bacteroidia bacterium]